MKYRLKTNAHITVEACDVGGAETVEIPMSVFYAAFELVPGDESRAKKGPVVSYDELQRVAAVLEEFAEDARNQAEKSFSDTEEVAGCLSEVISYLQAAKRLRKVALTVCSPFYRS